MLIDTYTHLDSPEFTKDLDDVLLRAKQAGVERIITIGINLESSRKAVQLAERYPQTYASVGIHPSCANEEREDFLAELEQLVKHPKVVAIGGSGSIFLVCGASKRTQKLARQCLEPLTSTQFKRRFAMKLK